MSPLWRQLERTWPLVAPEPLLAADLGADTLGALDQLRLLHREPVATGSRYPCDGCPRGRVVVEHEGTWAVCSCGVGCDPVDVGQVDRLELDAGALVHRLRQVLQLDGPAESPRWNRPARLGDRRFGVQRVVFGLMVRPRCVRPARLDRWLREQRGSVTVLLAPTRAAMPVRGAGEVWLSLDEVVDLQAGVADLSELALSGRLPGVDLGELLWPRFALVVDTQRESFTYAGQPLGLARSPRLAGLLTALAARPGEWVSRRELLLALYPDEITTRGRLLTDAVKLERRLRQLVSDLGRAFKELEARGLPANPIENLRARSDTEGGYRLVLPPERVFIHSGGA